jgi:hypothetical protein
MRPPVSPRTARFRTRVIDAFCGDLERCHYINRDRMLGVCPACDGALAIHFHGTAPRADLICEHGCTQSEIIRPLLRR